MQSHRQCPRANPFADANTQSCPTHKTVSLPTAAVLLPLAHRRQLTPSCPPRQIAHTPPDLELALVPRRRLRGRVEHFRQLASEAAESKVERAFIAVQRPVEGVGAGTRPPPRPPSPGAPIKTRRLTSNTSRPLVRSAPSQPPLTTRHTRPHRRVNAAAGNVPSLPQRARPALRSGETRHAGTRRTKLLHVVPRWRSCPLRRARPPTALGCVWPRSTAVRTATSPPPFSRRKSQDVAPLRVEHKLAHSLCRAVNGSLWPRRCLLRPSAPRCGLPSAAGGPRPPPTPSLQRSRCRAPPRQRELLPRASQALLT
ncbi:uncharacterized protein Tco025E_09698 [Trypanosoma conorhini]|uniref:Uncharacterized protein n=1 Tax=Trypanosoma conorhini TaxID=83891 RepID=A0A3R7M1R0_9TRYP|nr:uncharacterized protein Tco025E_09698 [Trypanosoma conorhini]RNE97729.1 hypothetical protein Tco025E_09698 [Trypanosoma conorhini]